MIGDWQPFGSLLRLQYSLFGKMLSLIYMLVEQVGNEGVSNGWW